MSTDDQLKCMQETFWNNRYYNTWIMFVGLTKHQLPITFKHFLSGKWFLWHTRFLNWWNKGDYCHIKGHIINDKIKCLHLFQCFSEAENNDLCQYVGQLLQANTVDLSGQTLSAVNILTISLFLARSTTKHWNVLNLSGCFIGDDGIKQLYNSFTSNNRSKVYIDTLNLSNNNLTQSSIEVIAGLILEWNVKDIIFDNFDQYDFNIEVMHQIMQRPAEQDDLITCNFNKNVTFFVRLSDLDYFILSFNSNSKETVDKITTTFTELQVCNDIKTDKLKILIHALKESRSISYLNLQADVPKFEIVDIASLIRQNEYFEHLYLPRMYYPILRENIILKMIFDALKSIKLLKYVDMSSSTIDSNLTKDVAAVMENNNELKEIKLARLFLKSNDFLLLKNHMVKIRGLKVFNITSYNFDEQDANILANAIQNNYKIQHLTLSHCQIPITNLLTILSTESMDDLNWLDLSGCRLHSYSIKENQIFSVLKQKQHLRHVDLRLNLMTKDLRHVGLRLNLMTKDVTMVNDLVAMIKCNKQIQSLFLPNYLLVRDLKIIVQALQTISSLQYVDLNTEYIDNELASDVATLFAKLKQIKFQYLTLKHSGFQDIKIWLFKFKGLKRLNITDCTFSGHDVALLETCICTNCTIQELVISNCKIIDSKVTTTVKDHVGIFDQLNLLELKNNNFIDTFVCKLSLFLSCSGKLKLIILCNSHLQPNDMKQIIMVLKSIRHLECVDLSGNEVTNDSVSDMEAMIINNKQLETLHLPNCVLSQRSLRIIIQAMQTISSLQYVDFNNNTLDDELASEVAILNTNNNLLKELRFSELSISQNGFKHLNNFLIKIRGLIRCNFTDYSFARHNKAKLQVFFTDYSFARHNKAKLQVFFTANLKFQELNLPNCIIPRCVYTLFHINKLKRLNLSNCLLKPNEINDIFKTLKQMKTLQHVDLSGNNMNSDTVDDLAAMIKNNEFMRSLSLPNGIMNKQEFRDIIQVTCKTSSLQYIDFGTAEVDDKIASDIATLFTNKSQLEELKFNKITLTHSGFHNLKKHFVKLRMNHISITDYTCTNEDVVYLQTIIGSNHQIKRLIISNCKITGNKVFGLRMADSIGRYDQLESLEMSRNSAVIPFIHNILAFLFCSFKLKQIFLCNCQLRSNETNQIIMVLKNMKHLDCIDLSGNEMTDDSVSDMEAMITNNKQLEKLCLPNCILSQKSLRIIIHALQTVSSLQYVDFNNNTLDDELANEVAILNANNSRLKELRFSKVTLHQSGLNLQNYSLVKIQALKILNIRDCWIGPQDAVRLMNVICNNPEIQEINCVTSADRSPSLVSFNTNIKLKQLNMSNCLILSNEIVGFLKEMETLQRVDLSGKIFFGDKVTDIAAMIKNNKHIQSLSLPNSIMSQESLAIIIQAMQTVSSLQYLDFNDNIIDSKLASDISLLINNNTKLGELKFAKIELNQDGFHSLKSYLPIIKGLKSFKITGCKFTDQDVTNLATAVMNNPEIEKIDLSYNKAFFEVKILGILSQLKTLSSLKCFILNDITITDQIEHEITTLVQGSKKLKRLEMVGCNLSSNFIMTIQSQENLQFYS